MFPAKQRHELMPRGNPETRLIVRTLPGQIPIRGDDLQPVGKIPDMLAMIDFRRSFRHGADQRPNKMLEFVIPRVARAIVRPGFHPMQPP